MSWRKSSVFQCRAILTRARGQRGCVFAAIEVEDCPLRQASDEPCIGPVGMIVVNIPRSRGAGDQRKRFYTGHIQVYLNRGRGSRERRRSIKHRAVAQYLEE